MGSAALKSLQKMLLDRFQLVNKLLKCVDWTLRTLHSVRGQFANFLVYVMFSEEALMNILAVISPYQLDRQHSSVTRTQKPGRHLLQTPAPQNICPQQPDVPVQLLRHRVPVLFWGRLLSRGREIIFIFLSDLLMENTEVTAHLQEEMVLKLIPVNVSHLGCSSSLHTAWGILGNLNWTLNNAL